MKSNYLALVVLLLTITTQSVDAQSAIQEDGNGINVGAAKLFDERSLRQMLRDAEDRLAALNAINPDAITKALGAVQGGRGASSTFGVTVSGLPTPGVVTTNGATTSLERQRALEQVTSASESSSPDEAATTTTGSTLTGTGSVTAGGALTAGQTVTQASVTPQVPVVSAATPRFESAQSFGLSARDLLAEQVSLTHQIFNLRLALEQSVSDRVVSQVSKPAYPRRLALIGFQVSIEPEDRYRDAVAEVNVTLGVTSRWVTPDTEPPRLWSTPSGRRQASMLTLEDGQDAPEANEGASKATKSLNVASPSLVMLLPNRNSYNVATITQDTKSLGLGIIAKVVQLGITSERRGETYYLVQDTDVVGVLRHREENRKELRFGWRFRPVLGRRVVDPGTRQVLALVSVPGSENQAVDVTVTVDTGWRKWKRGRQTVGKEKDPPIRVYSQSFSLPAVQEFEENLSPFLTNVDWWEIGPGLALVEVEGRNFLNDTQVTVGNSVLKRGSGLSIESESQMRFVADLRSLALTGAFVSGRYGFPGEEIVASPSAVREVGEYVEDSPYDYCDTGETDPKLPSAAIKEIVPINSESVELRIEVERFNARYQAPVVVVGDNVYGTRAMPASYRLDPSKDEGFRDTLNGDIAVTVPTLTLLKKPQIVVVQPLVAACYAEVSIDDHAAKASSLFAATSVAVLSRDESGAEIAISGLGFNGDTLVRVGGEYIDPVARGHSTLVLAPTWQQLRGVESIVVANKTTGVSNVLPLKAAIAKPTFAKITANKGDVKHITVPGTNLDLVRKIAFVTSDGETSLSIDDKKTTATSLVFKLDSKVTAEAGEKELVVTLVDGSTVFVLVTVKPPAPPSTGTTSPTT